MHAARNTVAENFRGRKPQRIRINIFPQVLYRIALIFRWCIFLRIAVLEEFVEKISRMPVAHERGSAGAQVLAESIARTSRGSH